MKDGKKGGCGAKLDPQELQTIKKILMEKYPDEDIEKILEEGDMCKVHEMLFTP
jgi:hypothetical protein